MSSFRFRSRWKNLLATRLSGRRFYGRAFDGPAIQLRPLVHAVSLLPRGSATPTKKRNAWYSDEIRQPQMLRTGCSQVEGVPPRSTSTAPGHRWAPTASAKRRQFTIQAPLSPGLPLSKRDASLSSLPARPAIALRIRTARPQPSSTHPRPPSIRICQTTRSRPHQKTDFLP